jgi:type IV secretion system protein TrbL
MKHFNEVKMKRIVYLICCFLLFTCTMVLAQTTPTLNNCDPSNPATCPSTTLTEVPRTPHIGGDGGAVALLNTTMQTAVTSTISTITSTATAWLSLFVLFQFILTQIGCLKSGTDLQAVLGKVAGSLLWFSFCFWIITNGPALLQAIGSTATNLASAVAGTSWDPGHIADVGCDLAGNVETSIFNAAHGMTDTLIAASVCIIVAPVILLTTALIAFRVFIIAIETQLIIMISPLSFSFLGLNALKDQGIAPLKSMIALLYRTVIMGIVVKCMFVMGAAIHTATENLPNAFAAANATPGTGIYGNMFAAALGFSMLAFIAFKSDSIAANLSSGSASLGTGDAAQAAAAGAAAAFVGAGVVAGAVGAVGSAIGAGGRAVGSMGEVLAKMGGGGSISNAGGAGSGSGRPGGGDAPKPPQQSLAERGVRPTPPPSDDNGGGGSTPTKGLDGNENSTTGQKSTADTPKPITGSGTDASIGGNNTGGYSPPRPSFADRLGTLNQHHAQEKATTGVQINMNNSHD